MTKYSSDFIKFSKERIARQGDEIRRWAQSDNPVLRECCKMILEAIEENKEIC